MSFSRILVPVDFSETSLHALRLAAKMARTQHATLVLLHVGAVVWAGAPGLDIGGPTPILAQWNDEIAREHESALRRVAREEVPSDVQVDCLVRDGVPAAAVLDACKETNADLIVIGTHGRRGLDRIFLGSVAESVIRESPVPVLVTR
jgi:universal stress protein A